MSLKEIKSIDIASYTTILTAIEIIFSIIFSIIVVIGVGITIPDSIGVTAYLVPTIIVLTLISAIFLRFSESFLYNLLTKRLNRINFQINDNGDILKVSTTETSIMVSVIVLILTVILYLGSTFILPLFLSAMMQTLMFSGQTAVAYSIYEVLMLISDFTFIGLVLAGSFIITFIFTLIATVVYNFLASHGQSVNIKLSRQNELDIVENINPTKLAIVVTIISLILNIIIAIVSLATGADASVAVGEIIGGAIVGFISAYLFGLFYNYLSPVLGKLKLKLIGI